MRRGRLFVALWTGVIILVVVPWGSLQNHAHWSKIGWIPFVSPPVRPGDIILNTLLYVPWGYLFARGGTGNSIPPWKIAAYAFVLSVVTEGVQVMSHGRFPSATDVVSNTAGAWLGASWAVGLLHRTARRFGAISQTSS